MALYTCIVCPNSCRIEVAEQECELIISGNKCARGLDFARKEHTDPVRMFTSTVRVQGGSARRLAVITEGEIRKADLFRLQKEIREICVQPPVNCGEVLVQSLGGTGVKLVASQSIRE